MEQIAKKKKRDWFWYPTKFKIIVFLFLAALFFSSTYIISELGPKSCDLFYSTGFFCSVYIYLVILGYYYIFLHLPRLFLVKTFFPSGTYTALEKTAEKWILTITDWAYYIFLAYFLACFIYWLIRKFKKK